jgi:hypothetical protein
VWGCGCSQLESSSNEEMEFEHVRFRELGCGCSQVHEEITGFQKSDQSQP